MTEIKPDLLTVPETAGEFRCSAVTVRRMIARGELRSVRVGRLLRVPRLEIERRKEGR